MHLFVEPKLQELFPHLTIGVVTGSIEAERPGISESVANLRMRALEQLHERVPEPELISSNPNVAAWRTAYQAFGVQAKKHKPTHESLARRLLKDGVWPEINPIVDLYLTNQAAHLLPHGGYDADTIAGTIRLSLLAAAERFEPLGGGEEFAIPGEVVYRDDIRILTRRWNYRDCDATKITPDTKHFVLMIESPSPQIPDEAITMASNDLVRRFRQCYVGTFASSVFRPWTEGAETSV